MSERMVAMAVCSARSSGMSTSIFHISDLFNFARVPLAKKLSMFLWTSEKNIALVISYFGFQNMGVIIYPALAHHSISNGTI